MPLSQHIEEVLKLVSETGDRCIVLQEGLEPSVVMSLESYRSLLQSAASRQDITRLSESELLEKINQDIAEWRTSRREELADYDLNDLAVEEKPVPTLQSFVAAAKAVVPPAPTLKPLPVMPNFPMIDPQPAFTSKSGEELPIVTTVDEFGDGQEYQLEPEVK